MAEITCATGKYGYQKYKDAAQHIASLGRRQAKHKYRVYKCNECGEFHVSTITKNTMWIPKKMNKYPIKWNHPLKPESKKKNRHGNKKKN